MLKIGELARACPNICHRVARTSTNMLDKLVKQFSRIARPSPGVSFSLFGEVAAF